MMGLGEGDFRRRLVAIALNPSSFFDQHLSPKNCPLTNSNICAIIILPSEHGRFSPRAVLLPRARDLRTPSTLS